MVGGFPQIQHSRSFCFTFLSLCVLLPSMLYFKPSVFMIIIPSSRPRYPSGRQVASRSSKMIWGHANAVEVRF
ncbi:hypothetical protein QBC32DRAFT_346720 [Pseudoneurospora amorphoporcata]|uniref:Uncharacterized protein n=1 Tax=Pseudoneurospora amorphoporcata TaxID=241081 RepID=A0AAN6SDJ6_9PEZI|nr:hypothetical protein QBC32DRAFT_346720 [Pseudoneurospora amorphoporcata]